MTVTAKGPMDHTIIPIKIRSDLAVLIQGLPVDLKKNEAEKIANVIKAFVHG